MDASKLTGRRLAVIPSNLNYVCKHNSLGSQIENTIEVLKYFVQEKRSANNCNLVAQAYNDLKWFTFNQ